MPWYCTAEAKSEADPSEAEDSPLFAEVKETGVASQTNGDDSEPKQKIQQDKNGSGSTQSTYSYEQLKAITGNAATGIDLKWREVCSAIYVLSWFLSIFPEHIHVLTLQFLRLICRIMSSRRYSVWKKKHSINYQSGSKTWRRRKLVYSKC